MIYRIFYRHRRLLAGALSALVILSAQACSSRLFSSGPDQTTYDLPDYRPAHPACSGLELTQSTLDVPTFKSLVNCFNSNGSIDPIAKLVAKMSDADIGVVTDTLNRHLLTDKTMLFRLERSFDDLEGAKQLGPAFTNFGQALENDDLVIATLQLFKDAWVPGSHVLEALTYLGEQVDYDSFATALNAAQNLTGSPTAGVAPAQALVSLQAELLPDMPEGLAYRAAQSCVAGASGLQAVTDCLSRFIRDAQDPARVQLGRELVNHVIAGDLLPAMDAWVGGTSDQLTIGGPRAGALVDILAANGGQILDGLTSLYHYLNVPVPFLNGAGTIPNADLWVMQQVIARPTAAAGDFVRRTNKLTLSMFSEFSQYPPELAQYYPALSALGATDGIETTVDLFKALNDPTQANGGALIQLLINTAADTGGSVAADPKSGQPENTAGVKYLIPAVIELSRRQAWTDIFLTQALLKPENRPTLVKFLSWLTNPVPALGGGGMYDVLTGAFARANPSTLFELVYSLRHYFGAKQPAIAPALDSVRTAFYVNDTHPIFDLTQSILRESKTNKGLFELLLKLHSLPEFRSAIQFTSQIAENGNLKDIAFTALSLFHKFAMQGGVPVNLTSAPRLVDERRHNIGASGIPRHVPITYPGDQAGYTACSTIDTNSSVLNDQSPSFQTQLAAWEGCLNAGGSFTDLVSSFQFLQSETVPGQSESYFDLMIDEINGLRGALSTAELQDLIRGYVSRYASGSLTKGARVLPAFISDPVAVSGQPSGPALRPAYDAVIATYRLASAELRRIWQFVKGVAARSDLGDMARFGDAILTQATNPAPSPTPAYGTVNVPNLGAVPTWIQNFECEADSSVSSISDPAERKQQEIQCLVSRVDRMLGNHECVQVANQSAALAERQRVFSDYYDAVTSWDLVDGQTPKSWDFAQFKSLLEPLLDRMADFNQSVPDKHVLDAPFNTLHYFTLQPGESASPYAHYTPLDFLHWLRDKSSDAKVISYYYPQFGTGCSIQDNGPTGNLEDPRCSYESTPRVRMLTTLDRLELVLINADFMTPFGVDSSLPSWIQDMFPQAAIKRNNAYYFLQLIAEAWGDEPESVWPPEIQALAASKRKSNSKWQPETLAQVAADMTTVHSQIESLMGYDPVPGCGETANPEDSSDVQKFETSVPSGTGWVGWLPLPELSIIRARAYNLGQVLDVMTDILPKKDVQGNWVGDPGARVLRDLFFELLYSTPAQYQNANEDCDKMNGNQFVGNLCHNSLWATMRLARVGILRQAGRLLREIPGDDASLQDFFRTMMSAVRGSQAAGVGGVDPNLERALQALIVKDTDHGLFWGVEQKLFGIVDAAHGVPTAQLDAEHQAELANLSAAAQATVRAGWVQELARLKQVVYYFVAEVGPNQVLPNAVASVARVLERFDAYLTSNVGFVRSLLKEPTPAGAVFGYYDVNDPSGRSSFNQVANQLLEIRSSDDSSLATDTVQTMVTVNGDANTSALYTLANQRFQAAMQLPDYVNAGMPAGSSLVKSLLNFLEDGPGTDPTAIAVRNFAISRLEAGDVDAFMNLAYRNPDQAYGVLASFANHVSSGDIDAMLAVIDAALAPAQLSAATAAAH